MRFSLFDWLILGLAVLACIALIVIAAYVEAVVVAGLMIVAVILHRGIDNRSGRLS